ncbi:hypothetical protein ACMYYO_08520 [Dermacoccaceae bacterium W4C1]
MSASTATNRQGTSPDLRVRIGGLRLRTPVLAAAGCGGYGSELDRLGVLDRLGGLVTPTLRSSARSARRRMQLTEGPSSLVLGDEWAAAGTDALHPSRIPWDHGGVPVIVSLAGATGADAAEATAMLRRRTVMRGVRGLEVNLAVPDEGNAGIPFSHSEPAATKLLSLVREELPRDVPMIAKLSADVTDVAAIARGCVKAGAEALVVTAPLRALVPGPEGQPERCGPPAALAGPALLPITLRCVWDLFRAMRIGRLPVVPVIAVGGIRNAHDAVQAIAVGATAVQLGSALITDPGILTDFDAELSAHLSRIGLPAVSELIGRAHD